MGTDKPGKPRVIRGRVSIERVVAEFERLRPFDAWSDPDYAAMKEALGHPRPEPDTSYADAKAEAEAGGVTIARFRRPAVTTTEPAVPPPAQPRGTGRPGWTRSLFDARYEEAKGATSPPHTPPRIAPNFRSLRVIDPFGVEPDTLAALIRRRARGDMPTE